MFSGNLDLVFREGKLEAIIFTVPFKSYQAEMAVGKQEKAAIRQLHTQHLRLIVLVPANEAFAGRFVVCGVADVTFLHGVPIDCD